MRRLYAKVRDWWDRLTNPRRRLHDVAKIIIDGLRDGSIVPDR